MEIVDFHGEANEIKQVFGLYENPYRFTGIMNVNLIEGHQILVNFTV